MSTSRYIRNFKAEAAIPAFTIVKNGTVDGNVTSGGRGRRQAARGLDRHRRGNQRAL